MAAQQKHKNNQLNQEKYCRNRPSGYNDEKSAGISETADHVGVRKKFFKEKEAMRNSICTLAAVLLFASFAQAGIVDWDCAADGDGAIVIDSMTWNQPVPQTPEYDLSMVAAQTNELFPDAHMAGWFDTEDDPTVRIAQIIDNDSDFDWTGYQIKFAMDQEFTVVGASTYGPAGWSTGWSPVAYGTVPFEGTVDTGWYTTFTYTGGDPILMGDPGEFRLAVNYTVPAGSTVRAHFCTEQTAIPEPAGLLLICLGGLFIARRR